MGRVGVLRIGKNEIETPALIPVIHPVVQDIPLSKYTEMGFGALMTNSFIAYQRRREEALEKGLHRMLGYEGIIMTDSGGYQVLQYGKVDITPEEIAGFQSAIGSNLAVTLDRPTGYTLSRDHAEETMRVSLRAARDTIERFRSSETNWVGPIQGGLFSDLVQSSARGLTRAGFQFLALGSPVEMMDNYLFSDLVRMIVAAKKAVPYSIPLHLFGAGHPLTIPLSVALGCDTFDSASYVLFARQGRYMTERGTMLLEEMNYLPCSCPICNGTSRTELLLMDRRERVRRVSLHNLYILRQDVLRCREAICEGRLWDLVEERASVHPRVASAFEEFARHSAWLSQGTAPMKERGLMVRSGLDLQRPELAFAAGRLESIIAKRTRDGAKRAVLLPFEKGKPLHRMSSYYDLLKESKKKGDEPSDLYKMHSILGPYPSELEFVYPFTQTVTDKEPSEREVRAAASRLRRSGYDSVVLYKRGARTGRSRRGSGKRKNK